MREITEAEKRELEDFWKGEQWTEEQLKEFSRRGFKIVKSETQISDEDIHGMAKARFNAAAPYLHRETLWDDLSGEGMAIEVMAMKEAIRKAGV